MSNYELKAEIIRRFGSQVAASRRMGIRESKLSYIIHKHAVPSARERKALEKSLGEKCVRKLLGRGRRSGSSMIADR